jgi:hypothetical protein
MANRFDLQNPAAKIAKSAAKGQTYGKATEQMASQSAVPMGKSPTEVLANRAARQSTPLTPIAAPTQRPDEPLTAGANFGAGPNMFQAGIPMVSQTDLALEELRAIAMAFPNDDLDDLLARYGIG